MVHPEGLKESQKIDHDLSIGGYVPFQCLLTCIDPCVSSKTLHRKKDTTKRFNRYRSEERSPRHRRRHRNCNSRLHTKPQEAFFGIKPSMESIVMHLSKEAITKNGPFPKDTSMTTKRCSTVHWEKLEKKRGLTFCHHRRLPFKSVLGTITSLT